MHFFGFHGKKYPLKVNSSQNKIIEFERKQIMPKNQACNRLYSDKVSKFWILGRFPTLLDPYWQKLLKTIQGDTLRGRRAFILLFRID